MQIKAGIKKEIIHLARTGRLVGLIIAFIAFATVEPALYKFLFTMSDNFISSPGDEVEYDIYDPFEQYNPQDGYQNTSVRITEEGGAFFADMPAKSVYGLSLSDISSSCLLIILLVLMSAGGGELKKKAAIIPICSGLKPNNYISAKFIVYPSFVMIMSIISSFICAGTSIMLFPGTDAPDISVSLITGVTLGLYLIFNLCIYFAFGLCTYKAGLGVVIVYLSTSILSGVFIVLGADKYHPYVLNSLVTSGEGLKYTDFGNYIISAGITLGICLFLYVLTLSVFNARQIDNRLESGGLNI